MYLVQEHDDCIPSRPKFRIGSLSASVRLASEMERGGGGSMKVLEHQTSDRNSKVQIDNVSEGGYD